MDGNCKPVVIILVAGGKGNESFEFMRSAAEAVGTSVSHLARLIESGDVFKRGTDWCCVDEVLRG